MEKSGLALETWERCGNGQVPISSQPWPVAELKDYMPWLNDPQPKEEIENIRYAIKQAAWFGAMGVEGGGAVWVGKYPPQPLAPRKGYDTVLPHRSPVPLRLLGA